MLVEDSAYLNCAKCKQTYDLLCANVTMNAYATLTAEFKKAWMCVECRSKLPKGDNSLTPVRQTQQYLHDMSIASDCPPDVSMHSMCSPDHVTVRTRQRSAPPAKESADNLSEAMQMLITRELKLMQDEFELRLSEKIRDIITEQFVMFKIELSNKVDNLTDTLMNKIKELERKIDTHAATRVELQSTRTCSNDSVNKSQHSVQVNTAGALPQKQQNRNNTIANIMISPTANTSAPCRVKEPPAPAPCRVKEPAPKSSEDLQNSQAITNVDGDGVLGSGDSDEWVEVKRGRSRASRTSLAGVRRGTASPGSTLLQASERWRYLHLFYVQEGTTVDQVQAHLRSICGSDVCTVDVLKSRGRYASFKLGVPSKYAESCMLPTNWAEDICVKPWRQNFRAKEKST